MLRWHNESDKRNASDELWNIEYETRQIRFGLRVVILAANIMRKKTFGNNWIAAAVFCLWAISASAQSNVVVRVMGANITSGNNQSYLAPGLDIFEGLKPDIVAIQEFNYTSTTTNGVNTPAAFREMIDTAFGTNFVYYREPYTASGDIPNGIISRYPDPGERFVG